MLYEWVLQLDIASQVVGRKDMTSSAFDIWGEVLISISGYIFETDISALAFIMLEFALLFQKSGRNIT